MPRSPSPPPKRISLLLRNLPRDARPSDIRYEFERYGDIKDVYLPKDYHTGLPRGIGFVEFYDEDDAHYAQRKMDRQYFMGREIAVVFAAQGRKRPDDMRRKEGGGRGYGRRGRSPSPRGRRGRSPSPRHRRERDDRGRRDDDDRDRRDDDRDRRDDDDRDRRDDDRDDRDGEDRRDNDDGKNEEREDGNTDAPQETEDRKEEGDNTNPDKEDEED